MDEKEETLGQRMDKVLSEGDKIVERSKELLRRYLNGTCNSTETSEEDHAS